MDFEFKPNDVAALTPGGRHVQRASERAWDDVLVVSHRTLSKPSGLFYGRCSMKTSSGWWKNGHVT